MKYKLIFYKDCYAHVIPCKSLDGLKTRHEGVPIDIVVIRENTQGGKILYRERRDKDKGEEDRKGGSEN